MRAIILVFMLIFETGLPAAAEVIAFHLRGPDGRPVAGQPVTLYLPSNNLVIDNCQTDLSGLCTLRDDAYVGQERCLIAIKPGWNFFSCAQDAVLPCLPNPVCAAFYRPDYYFLAEPAVAPYVL